VKSASVEETEAASVIHRSIKQGRVFGVVDLLLDLFTDTRLFAR
jgi:hypothetical protein